MATSSGSFSTGYTVIVNFFKPVAWLFSHLIRCPVFHTSLAIHGLTLGLKPPSGPNRLWLPFCVALITDVSSGDCLA